MTNESTGQVKQIKFYDFNSILNHATGILFDI